MRAALRYERVRVLTVRSTWICLGLTFLGVLGLAYLAASAGGGGELLWWNAFVQPLFFAAIVASVVAAQSLGQEYRFGLVRLTLTAFPQRGRILAAKAIVVVVAALVFVMASYASSWSGVLLHGSPTPPESAQGADSTLLLRGVVMLVLWCMSAWALAGITRQTALGIVVPIISGVIVEPILGAVLGDRASWLVGALPWSAAGRWAADSATAVGGASLPAGWEALGVFAVWVLLLAGLEIWLFMRRDA